VDRAGHLVTMVAALVMVSGALSAAMRSSQGGAIDVCALLPREEAGKILGYTVRARLNKRSSRDPADPVTVLRAVAHIGLVDDRGRSGASGKHRASTDASRLDSRRLVPGTSSCQLTSHRPRHEVTSSSAMPPQEACWPRAPGSPRPARAGFRSAADAGRALRSSPRQGRRTR